MQTTAAMNRKLFLTGIALACAMVVTAGVLRWQQIENAKPPKTNVALLTAGLLDFLAEVKNEDMPEILAPRDEVIGGIFASKAQVLDYWLPHVPKDYAFRYVGEALQYSCERAADGRADHIREAVQYARDQFEIVTRSGLIAKE